MSTSVGASMRGLVLRAPQPSLELTAVDTSRPEAREGEVLVEIRAAAVNRSDLLNVRGLPVTTFPRVLGRDFAGTVVDGPAEHVGREVWGSGAGDLGFSRDGSHAQYMALPIEGLVDKPASLTHEQAAACGLAYYTAAVATLELGAVRAGQRVLVLGAAGGVGSAAASLARWKGAQVIAAVKDEVEREMAAGRGITDVIDTSEQDLAAAVREIALGGVDVVVDTVGPALFDAGLASLGFDGRMIVMTAPPSAPVTLDLGLFYRLRRQLIGLSTTKGDVCRAATLLRDLTPGLESGELAPPAIAERFSLARASDAYALVAKGARGRVLLVGD